MREIQPTDFEAVEVRAGRITRAEPFEEARRPALKLWLDFGEALGERQSSAQLTRRYRPSDLVGRTVLAVVNLPPLRIAGFRSDVLVLGLVNPDDAGDVVLLVPDPSAAGPSADLRGWRMA